MPFIVDAPPPAIIQSAPLVEVRFGLSYAVSRVEYDRFKLPADWREAPLDQLRAWVPSDLRHLPERILRAMFPFVPAVGFSGLNKTTVLLTTTSATDQDWTVLGDWNNGDNTGEIISHGATGSDGFEDCCGFGTGDGGGGGGYAKKQNMPLTGGATSKIRIRDGNSGSGAGNASWIGNASTTQLSNSLVGIQGASGTNGGPTTGAQGDVKTAGSNASGQNGGAAAGGTAYSGTAGAAPGGAGGLYGGGGAGGDRPGGPTASTGGAGRQAIGVIVNNASL